MFGLGKNAWIFRLCSPVAVNAICFLCLVSVARINIAQEYDLHADESENLIHRKPVEVEQFQEAYRDICRISKEIKSLADDEAKLWEWMKRKRFLYVPEQETARHYLGREKNGIYTYVWGWPLGNETYETTRFKLVGYMVEFKKGGLWFIARENHVFWFDPVSKRQGFLENPDGVPFASIHFDRTF